MLDKEKAPQPKLEGENMDQYEHLNLSTLGCADAKEALEAAVSKKRESVRAWNERVQAFRAATDAPIPVNRFKEHPAFADLKSIVEMIFVGAEEDEASEYVSMLLSKISKDEIGAVLFDKKPRNVVKAWADASYRASEIASRRGDISGCAVADQNFQLASYLEFVLWEDGPVSQIPVSIAVREAEYG